MRELKCSLLKGEESAKALRQERAWPCSGTKRMPLWKTMGEGESAVTEGGVLDLSPPPFLFLIDLKP